MLDLKGSFYVCRNCGPEIDCHQEFWAHGDGEPFKIRLVRHIQGKAMIHKDEIILKEQPDGFVDTYCFCSKCNSLVRPFQNKHFEEGVHNDK